VLTADILNASVDIPGALVYSVAQGTIFPAGSTQIVSATFTPTDFTNYYSVTASVTLEVLNTTVPLPRVTAITLEGNRVHITFIAMPGRSYTLEYKSDLGANHWIDSGIEVSALLELATMEDLPGAAVQRFYRVTSRP
jgi:hypothetical protein